MQTFDVACPICGKVNRGLYLEETDGWMECESCFEVTRIHKTDSEHVMPLCIVKKLNTLPMHTAQAV